MDFRLPQKTIENTNFCLAVHLYFGRECPQIYSDEVLMGVAIDT